MNHGARIEWLQSVALLLEQQRLAMLSRNATAFCELSHRLELELGRAPQLLDPPPNPLESAWLATVERRNRHNGALLDNLTEPVRELGGLARQLDMATTLEAQA